MTAVKETCRTTRGQRPNEPYAASMGVRLCDFPTLDSRRPITTATGDSQPDVQSPVLTWLSTPSSVAVSSTGRVYILPFVRGETLRVGTVQHGLTGLRTVPPVADVAKRALHDGVDPLLGLVTAA